MSHHPAIFGPLDICRPVQTAEGAHSNPVQAILPVLIE
jgi:hypothetical protein